MGQILGKIDVETPKFEVIHSNLPDYEIRKYPPSVVAQVSYDPSDLRGDRDGGFMILASYIGAVGDPQNLKDQKSEKIAMTAPVITGGGKNCVTMGFLLPSKYKTTGEAPVATDGRVMLKEEGERKYGVVRFSGVATEALVAEKAEKLRECLERDGYRVVGEVVLARYNPPWTLPPFRTNDVMLPVND
ncbi:Soul heme-binding family protein [Zostera marina]|uniref:Soul heme-binding family protein n=1 Tax=Zostera marina TaxID=29655 RepID=A0A0K9NPR6_ZOSMR|nr:Soul heme-binding family protein [Zostera marina]